MSKGRWLGCGDPPFVLVVIPLPSAPDYHSQQDCSLRGHSCYRVLPIINAGDDSLLPGQSNNKMRLPLTLSLAPKGPGMSPTFALGAPCLVFVKPLPQGATFSGHQASCNVVESSVSRDLVVCNHRIDLGPESVRAVSGTLELQDRSFS